MINKLDYVKQWYHGTKDERLKLRDSLWVGRTWDYSTSDPGVETFLGSLAELIVLNYLNEYGFDYITANYQDFLFQKNDMFSSFDNRCDLELYSTTCEDFVPTEIKKTSKCVVEKISGTLTVPDRLITTAKREGAQFMLLVDGLRYASRDECNKDYGKLVVFEPHIIFYNIQTGDKAIILEPHWTKLTIDKILEDYLF